MKAVDVEVEKTAIQRTVADYEAATNKGGAEGAKGYASFATADARWLPPEAPAIRGREAIAQFAAGFTEMKDFRAKFDLSDVVVSRSGDIASSVGTYKITGKDREDRSRCSRASLLTCGTNRQTARGRLPLASGTRTSLRYLPGPVSRQRNRNRRP